MQRPAVSGQSIRLGVGVGLALLVGMLLADRSWAFAVVLAAFAGILAMALTEVSGRNPNA